VTVYSRINVHLPCHGFTGKSYTPAWSRRCTDRTPWAPEAGAAAHHRSRAVRADGGW